MASFFVANYWIDYLVNKKDTPKFASYVCYFRLTSKEMEKCIEEKLRASVRQICYTSMAYETVEVKGYLEFNFDRKRKIVINVTETFSEDFTGIYQSEASSLDEQVVKQEFDDNKMSLVHDTMLDVPLLAEQGSKTDDKNLSDDSSISEHSVDGVGVINCEKETEGLTPVKNHDTKISQVENCLPPQNRKRGRPRSQKDEPFCVVCNKTFKYASRLSAHNCVGKPENYFQEIHILIPFCEFQAKDTRNNLRKLLFVLQRC